MSEYVYTCLLCHSEADGRSVSVPTGKSRLVAYQEHLIEEHLMDEDMDPEQVWEAGRKKLAQATRTDASTKVSVIYEWTLPGEGSPWLRVERLKGMVQAGLAAGYDPQGLAGALNISWDVLAKLQACAITGESIPSALLRKMAEVTGVSLPLVEAYFDAPPVDSPFRCGPGPQQPLGKEPFWKSVSQSPLLSDTQKTEWLALVEAEGKR